MVCGSDSDLADDDRLRGDGAGEWLLSEKMVGETSAIGDEVFQPKKDVSLLGPGDRGVFVIIAGSEGSSSDLWSFIGGRLVGCNDALRCIPSLVGTFLAFEVSLRLACLVRSGREGGGMLSVFAGRCFPFWG